MYCYKDAQKILEYYLDKVVDKSINTEQQQQQHSLTVSHLKIVELTNNTFNVYCYFKGSKSEHFHRNIQLISRNLGLTSPCEILKTAKIY